MTIRPHFARILMPAGIAFFGMLTTAPAMMAACSEPIAEAGLRAASRTSRHSDGDAATGSATTPSGVPTRLCSGAAWLPWAEYVPLIHTADANERQPEPKERRDAEEPCEIRHVEKEDLEDRDH